MDVGALDHTETEDAEATFVVNEDSPVVQAASEFDDAIAERLDPVEAE